MLEHEGKWYARVTEIIADPDQFKHIDPAVLSAKTSLGSYVHQAIAEHTNGELPLARGMVDKNRLSDFDGYFESFLKWEKIVVVETVESERRYFCEKKMLCGQIDRLCCLISNDYPYLIDFKTAENESPKWELQAHLYAYLIEEAGIEIVPIYHFVKLNKQGKMPIVIRYKHKKTTKNKCMKLIDEFWIKQNKGN